MAIAGAGMRLPLAGSPEAQHQGCGTWQPVRFQTAALEEGRSDDPKQGLGAAKELGISPRNMRRYVQGAAVPRVVELALRGP